MISFVFILTVQKQHLKTNLVQFQPIGYWNNISLPIKTLCFRVLRKGGSFGHDVFYMSVLKTVDSSIKVKVQSSFIKPTAGGGLKEGPN